MNRVRVRWVLAHTSASAIDDGRTTWLDRDLNKEADVLARRGANLHPQDAAIVKRYDRSSKVVCMVAKYIAWRVARTFSSEQWKAVAPRPMRINRQVFASRRGSSRRNIAVSDVVVVQRGHSMMKQFGRWRCLLCHASGNCAATICRLACLGEAKLTRPHKLRWTAGWIWCLKCGCYSNKRARGLNQNCSPRRVISTRLKRLREARHPVTNPFLRQR